MKKGTRVIIVGKHPHCGRSGAYLGSERIGILGKVGHLVELDGGQRCYVFDSRFLRIINTDYADENS